MLTLRSHTSVCDIPEADWNALAGTYPFGQHAFLSALERSDSIGGDSGWIANPFTLYDDDKLIAAIPAYIKTHSYGEYVFDWAWADAYQRYNLNYYPKLILAIPFTPCQGPRLLSKQALSDEQLTALFKTLSDFCQQHTLSGCHLLFPTQALCEATKTASWMYRRGLQYHWFNHDYSSFDDFLARCTSRKRKELKKERRQVLEQGFIFKRREGTELTDHDWSLFYTLYCNTYNKRSGHNGYLTESFFRTIGNTMAKNILMVTAEVEGTTVAAALNFKSDDTLFGRYWGCLAEFDKLHFETCYYQGIDYCIEQGFKKFDAGAQGEHKIQRGFEPVDTHSSHWLSQEEFRPAIEQFLSEEYDMLTEHKMELASRLPFKKDPT